MPCCLEHKNKLSTDVALRTKHFLIHKCSPGKCSDLGRTVQNAVTLLIDNWSFGRALVAAHVCCLRNEFVKWKFGKVSSYFFYQFYSRLYLKWSILVYIDSDKLVGFAASQWRICCCLFQKTLYSNSCFHKFDSHTRLSISWRSGKFEKLSEKQSEIFWIFSENSEMHNP